MINHLNYNIQNSPYNGVAKNLQYQNPYNASNPKKNNKLYLFYVNDPHGNSDLMAGMVNGAKNFKDTSSQLEGDSFVLSAGDNYSGNDIKKDNYILDVMQNIMGVDVSAVGNHEVDLGKDGFCDIAKNKKMQFVATNVTFTSDNQMNEIVKKSVIKEQNGTRYGFIGTMPLDFVTCTKEDKRQGISVMNFEETISSLQNEIDNLKKQGIDRIILLSHSGYDVDKEYAKNLSGVDIIVGGHTHRAVEGAQMGENIVMSKTNEPVLITQAGENAKYYGIANIEFSDDGVIKKVGNKLFESPSMEKSPVLEKIKELFLGKSVPLGNIKEADSLPENRRIEPLGWTELMADAMRSELDTDIAIINSANVRKVPKKGPFTATDIVESTPMKNKLLKTKISQAQLVKAVKNASKATMDDPDGVPGLLQFSGITYKIDDKGNLLEMNFVDKEGKISPVDINNPSEDIMYTAAYDNFVAQKDGETPELFPQFEVEEFDFDKDKTMIDYISKMPDKDDLVAKTDGRLEIQKTL